MAAVIRQIVFAVGAFDRAIVQLCKRINADATVQAMRERADEAEARAMRMRAIVDRISS